MMALLEPGDEVIYPNPGFPIYESMIRFLGATPVPMPLEEERGFSFDLNLFRERLTQRQRWWCSTRRKIPPAASFRPPI